MAGRRTVEQRYWPKVKKSDAEDGCWEWQAGCSKSGYGVFSVGGKLQRAHRVGYWLLRGPIPEGLQLDHLCRNIICVRPSHLEAVTPQENMRRLRGHRRYSGHGSLTQRGRTSWRLRVYVGIVDGRHRQLSRTVRVHTEDEARERLAAFVSEVHGRLSVDGPVIDLDTDGPHNAPGAPKVGAAHRL